MGLDFKAIVKAPVSTFKAPIKRPTSIILKQKPIVFFPNLHFQEFQGPMGTLTVLLSINFLYEPKYMAIWLNIKVST